jgi:hypothetical protein
MSNEPERPVEKLLRATAKERRERAGSSWELHAVTRRRLQQEVKQQFGETPKPIRGSLRRLLEPWWVRALGGLTGTALVVVALWLAIPGLAPKKNDLLLARNDKDQSPLVSNSPRSRLSEKVSQNELEASQRAEVKEFAAAKAGGAKKEASLDENQMLREASKSRDASLALAKPEPIAPPLDQTGVAPATSTLADSGSLLAGAAATAPGPPTFEPRSLAVTTPNNTRAMANAPVQLSVTPGLAAAQTSTPQVTDLVSGLASKASEPELVHYGYFAAIQTTAKQKLLSPEVGRAISGSDLKTLPAGGVQAAAQILVSFRVEQSGRELRVIDSDDSVYAGPIQETIPAMAVSSAQQQRSGSVETLRAAKRQAGPAESLGLSAEQMVTPQRAFQVVGTNRSSNQRVVFSGTLTGLTNMVSLQSSKSAQGAQNLGGTAQVAEAQSNLLSQDFHVSGKAVIGQGQEVQIEAIPATVPGPLK